MDRLVPPSTICRARARWACSTRSRRWRARIRRSIWRSSPCWADCRPRRSPRSRDADQDKAIARFESGPSGGRSTRCWKWSTSPTTATRGSTGGSAGAAGPATGRLRPAAVRRGDPREGTPARDPFWRRRSGVSLGRLSGSQHLPRAAASPNKAVGDGRALVKALVSIITMVYHCFTYHQVLIPLCETRAPQGTRAHERP